MATRIYTLLAALVAGIGATACSASIDPTDDGSEATAEERQPFATAPFEAVHESITADALGFLRPDILLALQAANVSTDVEYHFVAANHFDNCDFSGGAAVVAESQSAAVESLGLATPEGDAAAIKAFGNSIHAAQDFYAHTNWVELGAEGLVDASLGPFPQLSPYLTLDNGVRLIEGPPPPNTTVWRDRDAAYPTNAIAQVKYKGHRAPGLISGSVDYEPGNKCPKQVDMTHDELNKDKSDVPGKEQQHLAAYAFAVSQTRHEWCRLVALTRARWGEAGAAHLLSWAADPAAASCESTTNTAEPAP